MNAPTFFGIATAVCLIAFFGSCIIESVKTTKPKVGDVYGHLNEGLPRSPDQVANPFALITVITKVSDDGKILEVSRASIHATDVAQLEEQRSVYTRDVIDMVSRKLGNIASNLPQK